MLWTLLIIYAAVGIISLVVLIGMLAIGGLDSLGLDVDMDLDVDADMDGGGGPGGPGFFSLPFILAFLSAFGGVGVLSLWAGVPNWISPIVAVGGAAFIIVIVFVVVQRFLEKFISDSTVVLSSLKGVKGTVSIPIRKGGEGQVVVLTPQRGRTILAAIASRDIKTNTKVVVVEVLGDVVKVVPSSQYKRKKAQMGGPK